MSQRPITGYFLSPVSGGENHEVTTPTDEPQLSETLSSTLGDQSGDSSVTDIAPARDQPVNHAPSNLATDIDEMTGQADTDTTQHNRNLADMLESAIQDELIPASDIAASIESDLAEQVLLLESQLLHETMQLDRERKEKTSMQHQIDLLQSELTKYQKMSDKQRQEIKKLASENDNLKRDLSRHNGMRRFTENPESHASELLDELQTTKAKFLSLKEHMVGVASQMICALEETPDAAVSNDDDDTPFTIVAHSKRGGQLLRQQRATARHAHSQPQPRQPTPPAPTRGQPIPVVCGITGPTNTQASQITRHQQPSASSTASQGTARGQHAATSSARQSPETIVIGTSLTCGLGAKLNAHGTNATCYTYAGSTIPEIRSRIPHVLPSDNQLRRIVIQCGGNDAESQPSNEIIKQYDNLIGDIQRRCPRASIILSKIPSRKKN